MLQEPFLSQHVKEQQNNSTDILDHNVQSDNKSTLALTDDKEEANIIRLYSNKNTLENQGFQCNVSWEEGGKHSRLSKKKRNTNSSLVNKNLHTIGRKKKCLFHGIHGFTGDIMFCIALYCFFVFFCFCGFVVISWPKSCVFGMNPEL